MVVDLSVELGPLRLAAPVVAAAGTFGYGTEFREALDVRRLGAIITKTITAAPRAGNRPPRLVETPAGMLNAVGLQNVGLEAFVTEKLPTLGSLGVPIIASVLAESPDELAAMVARVAASPAVAAVELNLSCPNITWKAGASPSAARGPMVAQDPEATARMVQAARAQTRKPLLAKLSPDVTDAVPIAEAAMGAGADILTLVNTFTGMSIDPHTRRSRLGSLTGGLSGPAIRPLAVYRVWRVYQALRCPILGAGGVLDAEGAVEFFLAGAGAVAVGTASFADPTAMVRVIDGLSRYAREHGVDRFSRLVGALEHDAAPAVPVG